MLSSFSICYIWKLKDDTFLLEKFYVESFVKIDLYEVVKKMKEIWILV